MQANDAKIIITVTIATAIAITIKMTKDCKPSRLIALPWEVRRPIIVEVLRHQRKRTPIFSRKFIESRVRLRNCFDENFSQVTNFYVARHKNRYLHGNALRATNRQLRYETNLMIQEELESGNLDLPFILDVMVVKDIGVFPTWISFPYRPTHIKKLTINIRIVRPGDSIVPDEWVEVARYHDEDFYSQWKNSPTRWNVVVMAVLLYAFGCFSVKPDPAQPLIQRESQEPPAVEDATPAKKKTFKKAKASKSLPPAPKGKKGKYPILPSLVDHQSDTFNAYILPSPSYIIDELSIDFKGCEYDVQNNPIPPSKNDSSTKKSRFYKEGCLQFGREVFRDYNPNDPDKDYEELDDEQYLISQGKHACYQLEDSLCIMFWEWRYPGARYTAYGPYLEMLARSTGVVLYSPCRGADSILLERHPSCWIDNKYACIAWLDPKGYSKATIERVLAREMANASPDEDLIADLRLLQIRRAHGWVYEEE